MTRWACSGFAVYRGNGDFEEGQNRRKQNRSWNFVKILIYVGKLRSEVAGL